MHLAYAACVSGPDPSPAEAATAIASTEQLTGSRFGRFYASILCVQTTGEYGSSKLQDMRSDEVGYYRILYAAIVLM